MPALHPEFPLEEARVAETVEKIIQSIVREDPYQVDPDKYWEVYGGADELTAMVFRQQAIVKWDDLKKIKESPYFGRIDFAEDGCPVEERYIGFEGIQLPGLAVIDWRAPFGQLFYRNGLQAREKVSYLTPGSPIRGELFLKRHIKIFGGRLQSISDEIDRRANRNSSVETVTSEEILIRDLYTRGDPRLQDIVRTIQEHQDSVIRAPSDGAIIINGVAGSGKTSIAYHRVAYLLFPDTHSNILPSRTIIFGPNRLFVSYVKDLLPTLRIRDVIHVTFDDWALERMGFLIKKDNQIHRKYSLRDISMLTFLDSQQTRQSRVDAWKRASLKGREKIKTVLERYVQKRIERIALPSSITYKNLGQLSLTLALTETEIKETRQRVFQQNSGKTFQKIRDTLLNVLSQLLAGKYNEAVEGLASQAAARDPKEAKQLRSRAYSIPSIKSEAVSAGIRSLQADFERWVPPIRLRDEYYDLLSNRRQLQEIGRGLLTVDEVNLLSSSIPEKDSIDIEDIPALFYFHFLMIGKREEYYDHIIVDEAQDFSPLQYKILRLYSKNGSMTILGDISQGIFAHRGITDWNEVTLALGEVPTQLLEIKQNYRSTTQIVQFTNAVLKEVRKEKAVPAIPFERPGNKPIVVSLSNEKEMYTRILQDIHGFHAKNLNNIGIIAKTDDDCQRVFHALSRLDPEVGLRKLSSRDSEYDYEGGVVILSTALAKGIEFQAVLVINVSETNYSTETEYEGRLLYVAVTRALHQLNMYCVGKVSGYLKSALPLAIQTQG